MSTDVERRTDSVSVVVAAHTMERLEDTLRCLRSILAGRRPPDEVVLVVDGNAELLATFRRRLAGDPVLILENKGSGASAARNTGLAACNCEIVLFIDDDAYAEPGWLATMSEAFEDQAVAGVGGRVLPEWEPGARELPEELLWIVGSTYKGHPENRQTITRPIGASMGARRNCISEAGGFPAAFGPREGKKLSSNEELALYSRIRAARGGDSVVYLPDAVVHHRAPAKRTTLRYVLSRSWVEGTSKADVRSEFGTDSMAHDQDYARRVLLPAIVRYGVAGLRPGHPEDRRHFVACVLSLGAAAGGYAYSLANSLRRSRRAAARR